jgi:hypothetical protein
MPMYLSTAPDSIFLKIKRGGGIRLKTSASYPEGNKEILVDLYYFQLHAVKSHQTVPLTG